MIKKAAKICDVCGEFLSLQWSDHCTGYIEYVGKDGSGFGDSDVTRGEGGTVGCDSFDKYICNGCGKEFDDIEELETEEVDYWTEE